MKPKSPSILPFLASAASPKVTEYAGIPKEFITLASACRLPGCQPLQLQMTTCSPGCQNGFKANPLLCYRKAKILHSWMK